MERRVQKHGGASDYGEHKWWQEQRANNKGGALIGTLLNKNKEINRKWISTWKT